MRRRNDGSDINSTNARAWAELRDSQAAEEATKHIEQCLFDIADPEASSPRKQRATEWLGYWATELERMVNNGRAHPVNRPVRRSY